MFDDVPVRAWLIIMVLALGFRPARYAFTYISHSPSRRDITQPPVDLSWRSPTELARCLIILCALLLFTVFIFTPEAEQFARSDIFLPLLLAAFGAFGFYTVAMGWVRGQVEPLIKGVNSSFERFSQPKRYWASLCWNAIVGGFCIWIAGFSYREARDGPLIEQCYNESQKFSSQQALAACTQLIGDRDASPEHISDYVHARGLVYSRAGDTRRAIAEYGEAIRLEPKDSTVYFNRGLAYDRLGDRPRAISDYSEAIRIDPKDYEAHLNRGLVYLDDLKLEKAAADFTRAHQLKPGEAWPLANRGISYAWLHDHEKAQKDFDSARRLDPKNQTVRRGEALIALNEGDLPKAVQLFTIALDHDPEDRWSLFMRADAYRRMGDDEKMEADLGKVKELGKAGNQKD
jgi:tetratricopeptide (TPR) repeat protein